MNIRCKCVSFLTKARLQPCKLQPVTAWGLRGLVRTGKLGAINRMRKVQKQGNYGRGGNFNGSPRCALGRCSAICMATAAAGVYQIFVRCGKLFLLLLYYNIWATINKQQGAANSKRQGCWRNLGPYQLPILPRGWVCCEIRAIQLPFSIWRPGKLWL